MEIKFVQFDERFLEASFIWFKDADLRRDIQAPDISWEIQKTWFNKLKERTDYKIWGIEVDGRPAGATGLKHITQNTAEYWGYIGEKEMRGKGIGKTMLAFVEQKACSLQIKTLNLFVLATNYPAISLYQQFGYVTVENSANKDLLEMKKEIVF